LELRAVLDTLDDIGYDGPLTVELYEPYRTGPVVKSTVDTLNTVL
jgi:sugar phosphate isomerase/epimerase